MADRRTQDGKIICGRCGQLCADTPTGRVLSWGGQLCGAEDCGTPLEGEGKNDTGESEE